MAGEQSEVKPKLTVAEQEQRLWTTSLEKLQNYFDGTLDGGDEVTTAVKTANMLVKHEGAQVHREALRFATIQAVCRNDPDKLAKIVETMHPELKSLPDSEKTEQQKPANAP